MKDYRIYYPSPIGILEIISNEKEILSVEFVDKKGKFEVCIPILKEAYNQLDEYFKGRRKVFHLNISLKGTDFQKKVWSELMKIQYGEVFSYKEIAKYIGNEKASRAVGGANNKNKISIIIPCHRVIGSNGKLAGYAHGIWRKEWLLEHEKYFNK